MFGSALHAGLAAAAAMARAAVAEGASFCCLAAPDPDQICSTCPAFAKAPPTSPCAVDATACLDDGCGGQSAWCEDDSFSNPFDCEAGYANWEAGWSRNKKDWCCEHERRGCKADEEEEGSFCCLAGAQEDDMCGSCFRNAMSREGDHCGGSRERCEACGGGAMWCGAAEALPGPVPADTTEPAAEPTAAPTVDPIAALTGEPTAAPTAAPSAEPTEEPTAEPTAAPTAAPTAEPTAEPTLEPTAEPSAEPTAEPAPPPGPQPTASPAHGESPEGPYCCLAGTGKGAGVCGECFDAAKAFAGSVCGESRSSCESCGGGATWCDEEDGAAGEAHGEDAVDDEDDGECCLAAADHGNFCASCYPTAWAKPGGHCGGGRSRCEACQGHATWCPHSEGAGQDAAAAPREPSEDDDGGEEADARSEGSDFCCLAGSDNKDICGSCFSTAVAKPSTHCGASRSQCETCGGKATWCSPSVASDGDSDDSMELMLHLEDVDFEPHPGEPIVIKVNNRTFQAEVVGGISQEELQKAIMQKSSESSSGRLRRAVGAAIPGPARWPAAACAAAGVLAAAAALSAAGSPLPLARARSRGLTRRCRTARRRRSRPPEHRPAWPARADPVDHSAGQQRTQ